MVDLHDGLVKEVHYINDNYVDRDRSMEYREKAQVRMLIQKQGIPANFLELIFEGVSTLVLSPHEIIFEAEIKETGVDSPERSKFHFEFCYSEIEFDRMMWREVPDWYGPEARFGEDFRPPPIMTEEW
ncbi:MAG: hypothetical protein R2688_02630 [Fimbriimonadaceae bacterium]